MSKWMRRASGIIAILMLTMSFSGQASARILFQDDSSADVVSEGIIINSDDGGDEDVTLQLGNDTTDATITFDDGTGDVSLAAPGGDFSFSDDNLAGTGGLDFDGAIDFSNSTSFTMRSAAAAPGTCTEGEIYYNTTDNTTYSCTATNTWTAFSSGSQDFESVYGADGDNTLTTSNGAFTINTGTNDFIVTSNDWSVDASGNIAGNNVTANGTLDANGIVTLGDNGDTVAIDSSDWDISTTGDMTGIGAITMDGLLTGTAGATLSGAAVSLNNNSNFAVDIATGTSTGAVSIGGGSNTVAINTTSWDISSAGVASGFTGLTSTGTVDFSGASRLALHQGAANPGTCTEGDIFYNTTDDTLYVCTATNTWTGQSDNQDFESVYSNDGDNTLTASGTFDIDATGALGIDSDAAVTVGGAGISVTSDGGALALTGDGTNDIDLLNTGAAIDIDSATMTIDTTSTFGINTSSWDITGAGAASGFTTFDASGNITTSAGDFIIGTTGLTETTGNTDSGAYLVGIFDEFDNSAGANVQDVVDDIDAAIGVRTYTEDNVLTDNQSVAASLDALDLKWGDLGSTANGEGASLVGVEDSATYYTATDVEGVLAEIGGQIGSNAANVDEMTFEPEYPNAVIYTDGSNNKGLLEALYDNTNRENYYSWSSKQNSQQDIEIRFRYELPADFVDAGNLTLRYRTNTTNSADNSVQVIVRNDTDNTTCHTDAAAASGTANTWGDITVTGAEIDTGCTASALLAAGDIIEVQLILVADDTNTGIADVGTLVFDYTN